MPNTAGTVRSRAPPQTWRYVLYALLPPLALGPILVPRCVMKAAQDNGHQEPGFLVLLAVLVAVAVVGPGFERIRARFWLGEEIGHRSGGNRVVRHAAFLVLNTLLGAPGFLAVAAG